MVENTSRDGCRADQFKISDTPHTRYYNNGVPILTTIVNGNLSANVIEKSIIQYTVSCPDCQIDIYYDEDEEPVCENCGLLVFIVVNVNLAVGTRDAVLNDRLFDDITT